MKCLRLIKAVTLAAGEDVLVHAAAAAAGVANSRDGSPLTRRGPDRGSVALAEDCEGMGA